MSATVGWPRELLRPEAQFRVGARRMSLHPKSCVRWRAQRVVSRATRRVLLIRGRPYRADTFISINLPLLSLLIRCWTHSLATADMQCCQAIVACHTDFGVRANG